MQTYRLGRKLKLPSTRAIKHEVLTSMWLDALKAQAVQSAQSAAIEKSDTKMQHDLRATVFSACSFAVTASAPTDL
jgi:hypothetical protein